MARSRAGGAGARWTRIVPALLCGLAFVCCSPQPASRDADAAARFNGTWTNPAGEFRLWAIDERRLQVEFHGQFEYQSAAGPMVNVGEGTGVAPLENGAATFRPDGADTTCAITLQASGDRLDVTETGTCGFGLNVTAQGAYRRIDSKRPSFTAGG
jgi:hypothetical protein